jgi:hypothetical protein
MRRYLVVLLLACALPAHALESLRVGSQVLSVGDSAARVRALLGNPSGHGKGGASGKAAKSSTAHKGKSSGSKSSSNKSSKSGKNSKAGAKDKGEKWQYWRDGHATTVTIVDGKVAHIEDVAR